jgi:hypothetical protein
MKNFFLRNFKTHAVLIVLLFAAVVIVLYRKHASPAVPDISKPVVYYLSDELHFAAIPYEIEQEQKTGKVVIDKVALRAHFPTPKPLGIAPFVSMRFLAPGTSGLEDPGSYFSQSPLLKRDRNIVSVVSMAPRSKAEYARNPPDRDEAAAWRRELPGGTDKHKLTEYLGMKCVDRRDDKYCIAEIRPGSWAHIRINNESLRKEAFWPSMRVMYYSDAYGGLDITWDAYIEHVAKWREIDAKFWQLLHERNVLKTP